VVGAEAEASEVLDPLALGLKLLAEAGAAASSNRMGIGAIIVSSLAGAVESAKWESTFQRFVFTVSSSSDLD